MLVLRIQSCSLNLLFKRSTNDRGREAEICLCNIDARGRWGLVCRKEAGKSEDYTYWLSKHTPGLHDKLVQTVKCELYSMADQGTGLTYYYCSTIYLVFIYLFPTVFIF